LTILVLLFLAVLWAAVLAPAFLRNRAESRSSDSIGDFRRQLGVLQRTGPNIVSPANVLRSGEPSPVPGLAPPERFLPRASRPPELAACRQRTLRRRRDVLVFFTCGLFGSLVLGAIPAFRMIWVVSGVLAVAMGAYVALLVRMKSIAAEREAKLAYLPEAAPPEPALMLRRSVN
jgi:Flp pilus assembly protein TadB